MYYRQEVVYSFSESHFKVGRLIKYAERFVVNNTEKIETYSGIITEYAPGEITIYTGKKGIHSIYLSEVVDSPTFFTDKAERHLYHSYQILELRDEL